MFCKMPVTVAVVGAGPVGLMAMKNLKEVGFEVSGFEKRGYVGGLWKQSWEDSSISVTEHTVFNSSRFRSSISDYPFPDHYDDYPTAKQLHGYLESYCDHFDLRRHIRLDAEIKSIKRDQQQDGIAQTQRFDKVMICTGSFVSPKTPKLAGIDKFQGTTMHSVNFPHPSRFKDQNVLLVGLHATAQDLTVELHGYAKKVYIAHRIGLVLLPRFMPDGRAMDVGQTLGLVFIQLFMEAWFPRAWAWVMNKILASMSSAAFPNQPEEWRLKPHPSAATVTPLVGDAIYPHLQSGFATPVAAVDGITGPKTVRLTDGRVLEDIDAIIYCTGYDFASPCRPEEYDPFPVRGQPPNLYRNIFPIHEDAGIRNSLAFLGYSAIVFSGLVQFELSAMAVSQIWRGNASPLPSLSEMQRWRARHLAWRRGIVERAKPSETHSFVVAFVDPPDYVSWVNETAGLGMLEHFGTFSRKAWRFWWHDRDFYSLCKNGVFSPAMWRLFDMGKRKAWVGAREQIIKDNELVKKRGEERLVALKKERS
ncbi:uncharacterized protein PV06_00571 [Exophiala oligosperma]|uniref:FAD/NAD(P)-binding domain-containing protein n=1 Tax=Exophiala oligosperma TaxID=215243 RepID=A0A0D2CDJ3_9EURO|nr:uncharacterized protein PV06_00571 [Exophiala oligosperma]KIW47922.1 hypothetical protein PV06_00571 [Exophiala oligosperma]